MNEWSFCEGKDIDAYCMGMHYFAFECRFFGNWVVFMINHLTNCCYLFAREQFLQIKSADCLYLVTIKTDYNIPVVAELSTPNLTMMSQGIFLLIKEICLFTKRILINGDYLLITQYRESLLGNSFKITTNEEGRL